MKKRIITLIATLSMLCFVSCGSESTENAVTNVGAGSNQEAVAGTVNDEPTAKPTTEATAESATAPNEVVEATTEPTKEPITEVTPEPTEERVLYSGIDMNSDLSGEEWVATFIGVIEEPKVVIYNDETGRKEIVEESSTVTFNPDKDTFVLYLPEGYDYANKSMGLEILQGHHKDFGYVFILNAEKIRETKFKEVAVYVKNNVEEIKIEFMLKSE